MIRSRAQMLVSGLLIAAAVAAVAGCKSEEKAAPATPPPAAAPAPAPAPVPAKPLSVEESASEKVTARVTAVDYATRQITLEEASGRTVTLVAGSQVRRLNEVRPGDSVSAEYTVSILAELRPPTPEEAAAPVAAVEVAGRSPQGATPAAGVVRGIRVVTTIQAVDQPKMLVTLRGPGGNTFTVRGRNPDNVAKLKVGDTIVITYTESAVIALEKAGR